MGTIADAKFTHNYNCYNGYFIGCLLFLCLVEVPKWYFQFFQPLFVRDLMLYTILLY